MAKKRKKRASKKIEETKSSGFWRGIGAVFLIILGIVIGFGSFINAPIPKDLWNGSWSLFGLATIVLPFAMIYLGSLKFLSEDQQIPLPKMAGTIGLLVFLAAWMHTAFMTHDPATGTWIGGHGGSVGKTVGDALGAALGKFLSSLVFFVLSVFAAFFTFKIDPRVLLKLVEMFRREKKEGDGEEDLASLKSRMGTKFELNEGVPVEHHAPGARMTSLRNTAQKLSPDQDHAALTAVSDPDWQFPALNLLNDKQDKADAGDVQGNAEIIKDTFANFNIDVGVEGANVGPRVTQYTLKPPTGVKLSRLTALENNLALDLAAQSIRMEAPIPGKRAVGIEVPNVKPATVTIRSLLSSPQWSELKTPLGLAIGKDI